MMQKGVSEKNPKPKARPARYELIEAINEYRIPMMNQLTQ